MHDPTKNEGPFFCFMPYFTFERLQCSHNGSIPFQFLLITNPVITVMDLFNCVLSVQGRDPFSIPVKKQTNRPFPLGHFHPEIERGNTKPVNLGKEDSRELIK